LYDAGHDVALVISRADARRGRRAHASASPVKATARELGIPVSDKIDDAADVGADLGVVVAYGRIIPARVLAQLPMINVHYSLLPRWRGAAPLERAILAGDDVSGVCLMEVAEGLDTGDVYDCVRVPITPHETADELRARLVDASVELLLRTLADGIGEPTPQVGEVTYAEKIDPTELQLDWTRPAEELERLVRVGGAWTPFRGHRLKIWRAIALDDAPGADASSLAPGELRVCTVGTGHGVLELIEVQAEGKPRRNADAWLRGAQPVAGERLGQQRHAR
jgi:methionyl-tRNA formyltransferase